MPTNNPYAGFPRTATQPAIGALAVTPSDSTEFAAITRAITIGTAGKVSYVGLDDKTYTTGELPSGTYAVWAKRIRATGTTASNITAWT